MRSLKYQRGFLGKGMEEALTALFVAVFVFGVLFGWVIWEGVPMFWQWIKPWIHQVTG